MCGFVGGNNTNWDYSEAVKCIRHRGPDSQKIVSMGDVTIGFARLAVIDPTESADQPMASEKGEVTIVFNGEIYGYRELRLQLEKRGHRFRTTSDTEVLLQAYLEWGDGWVDRMDGMFSVIIYDHRILELKLFRDRVGIKPLYYLYDGRNFAFASELKAIRALCRNIQFELDYTAVYDYLTYRYIPAPKTLYRHVYKLAPAHQFSFNLRTRELHSMKRYWSLDVDTDSPPLSADRAAEQLRILIDDCVASQLVADVPVGCFLSGGVDSSVIVATASKHVERLKTFSIGFDIPSHSETDYAALIAARFKTDHLQRILSFEESQNLLSQLSTWYDEPFGDTSAVPTFLVSRLAREHVTVVLTGDGGDEIFGGYRWYKLFKLCSLGTAIRVLPFDRLFRPLKNRFARQTLSYRVCNGLEAVFSNNLTLYAKLLRGLTGTDKETYAERWRIAKDYDDLWYFRQYWRDDLPILTRLQYLDFHTYLPDDILTKVDRASMAVSLEARVPFLSRRLVEFVFSVDEKTRYLNAQLKGLLKYAFRDRLPPVILARGKKGFSIPRAYYKNYDLTEHEVLLRDVYEIW
jgi:asparagine synthase (glutamine-hydrolysing)